MKTQSTKSKTIVLYPTTESKPATKQSSKNKKSGIDGPNITINLMDFLTLKTKTH